VRGTIVFADVRLDLDDPTDPPTAAVPSLPDEMQPDERGRDLERGSLEERAKVGQDSVAGGAGET
jgi:hypothetical protein